MRSTPKILALTITLICFSPAALAKTKPFSAADIMKIQRINEARVSPDGEQVAVVMETQRAATDKAGKPYQGLFLIPVAGGEPRPFITGKVSVSHLRWDLSGRRIGFLAKRGGDEAKTQVWAMAVDGGEAVQVTRSETNIISFEWRPGHQQVAFITVPDKSKRQKALDKKGYGFIYFQEQRRPRNLFLQDVPWAKKKAAKPRQLTRKISVWDLAFSPTGDRIALSATSQNAIDDYYMFRRIHLLTVSSGKLKQVSQNPGKLGGYSFSPDGKRLVYVAARSLTDHAVTSAFELDLSSGKARDVTPPGLKGHVGWAGWLGGKSLLLHTREDAETLFRRVSPEPDKSGVLLNSVDSGAACWPRHLAADGKLMTLVCDSPDTPSVLKIWPLDGKPRALTRLNRWVKNRRLGEQTVIHHKTRDGLRLNGILVKPLGFKKGKRYPLIVLVHGGPESNFTRGWTTRYSRPAQLWAARGYLTFMPNYRSSTGYGPDLPRSTIGDAGGKEFDDIIDGIKHLVDQGLADQKRVGLVGGSYGGYAAGLFGTRHTRWVRAVGMFVGVSDLISKRGVSDIPYEVLHVHHGKPLEKMWQAHLKQSPIYWAHQSKTAFLIYGGTKDSRVPPSQSVEMFMRLKMNKHPATRLVQYPGEGHGNRKQPGRLDVILRVTAWMDWYVKDLKPLAGPMPPVDLSKEYGLKLKP